MYTAAALLDIHDRSHRSLRRYIDHCHTLTDDEQTRELPGFGYPSVRLQLHHIVGAEKYWLSVIEGQMDASENMADAASLVAIESFRARTAAKTRQYLSSASNDQLNTSRPMTTWNQKDRLLIPAHVILRTQTHIYNHLGQICAMCRTMDKTPPPGMDFPLD